MAVPVPRSTRESSSFELGVSSWNNTWVGMEWGGDGMGWGGDGMGWRGVGMGPRDRGHVLSGMV